MATEKRLCWGDAIIMKEPVVFLTLGDGDFSYSLDLARYLLERRQDEHAAATPVGSNDKTPSYKLIATGIDSLTELTTKYRNAPNIMKKLQGLSSKQHLKISIHHGINALNAKQAFSARHVIFNHPHLGTEDAQLHTRFLSHLFHAANQQWMMRNGGLLHITLFQGQLERWNALESAEQQGLQLLHTHPFVPPPCSTREYQHRRHQTGKSFDAECSETYTFCRKKDQQVLLASTSTTLPWHQQQQEENNNNKKTIQEQFSCPYCCKSFREERSLKNHIKSLHNSKKRKRPVQCQHCQRTFQHQQGLQDHVRAKHSALHSNILPEWAAVAAANKKQPNDNKAPPQGGERGGSCISATNTKHGATDRGGNTTMFGSCHICGLVYNSRQDELRHLQDFVPKPTTTKNDALNKEYICRYCSKQFREERAKLQHENFCSNRKMDYNQFTIISSSFKEEEGL